MFLEGVCITFQIIPRLQRCNKSSHTAKDLKVLWDRKGVETIDVASGQKFNMRAMVLWTINDFPAQIYFLTKTCKKNVPTGLGSQIRQRHVDNDQDPEVSTTNELFALANGPSWTPISVNSCVVDGVRYVVHSRDERRTTQNSGICSPGPDGEMYYGQLQEIIEFKYLLFKVALFRVKWFDTSNKGRKVNKLVLRNNMTQIDCSREAFKDDQYILVTQVKQVFYLEDKTKPHWKVVEHVNHKKFSDGGVIVVEDDPDIIHFDNSSDLPLSTSLNDLNNATLHIDGQSTVVDAPPDIIDVPDEDDDIIGDEDALPHDLADSDAEDLINVDDDGVEKMSADVARSHGGDGGGDDRPPSHVVPTGCGGCFANKGKGKRKPNLGGRGAGRLNTRDKTRNLSLKEIAVAKGPVPINFEQGDKQTLNPLGPHAAHWSNYIGEVVRSVPLYYPSWEKVPKERKAAIISEIGTLFDLRPHMDSSRWTEIYEGINMHLQKAYNTNKASFKAKHWKADPTTGTYDVEAIRRARPEEITAAEWDKYIKFWNDPKNLARAAQNRLNRQKSVVTSRQGSRSLARLRDEMRQASDTQEYPSLIDTFWRTHTVDGVFPKDEDRRIYEEVKRLEATSEYTEDEINALTRGGKLRGHIPGVGQYSDMFKEFESGGASGSGGCGDDEDSGNDEDGEDEDDDGKSCGPTSSPGIIAGDCIPDEVSPARIPQGHVAGEMYPHRHVAGELLDMSLGKHPIVVYYGVIASDANDTYAKNDIILMHLAYTEYIIDVPIS
ncbi:zinc finger, CCHC-type containing protein [Tanacetum coccineum]